jgi:hypothetical protein
MAYWELDEQHRRSFLGRSFRFGTVDGPQELYSFSTRTDRPEKPDADRPGRRDPMYFLTKSDLVEAIHTSAQPGSADVFERVRQGIALCEDWNEMRFVFILDIPEGHAVEAWFGLAKFQSRYSSSKSGGASLAGRWLQYIVELDDRQKRLLRGPLRTGK